MNLKTLMNDVSDIGKRPRRLRARVAYLICDLFVCVCVWRVGPYLGDDKAARTHLLVKAARAEKQSECMISHSFL